MRKNKLGKNVEFLRLLAYRKEEFLSFGQM